MFIFLDETVTDRQNAYSFRGKPAVAQKLLVREHHVSAIAIMSTIGVLDCHILDYAVDGNICVRNSLLPQLMPFDGGNLHSTVILDNASVHHVDGIADIIQEVGTLVMHLHLKSDHNPIKELLFKLKSIIQSHERELQSQADDIGLEDTALSLFCHITAEDGCSWIANSEI